MVSKHQCVRYPVLIALTTKASPSWSAIGGQIIWLIFWDRIQHLEVDKSYTSCQHEQERRIFLIPVIFPSTLWGASHVWLKYETLFSTLTQDLKLTWALSIGVITPSTWRVRSIASSNTVALDLQLTLMKRGTWLDRMVHQVMNICPQQRFLLYVF